ncbi:MAG: hypothetical protein HUJ66_05965 [Oscillospiraceae bacterium]|nr:hypothetical protein [Oscillospiraceae bacterium]
MNEHELKQIAAMLKQMDYAAGDALRRNNLPGAILAYEQMMDAELAIGLEKNAGRTRINLANLYLQVNRNEKALEHARRASDALARFGAFEDVINARLTMARCLCALDRHADGIREAENALRDCRTDAVRGEAYLVLAECERLAGDRWKARNAADRAVRCFEGVNNQSGLARALYERISLLEQNGQSAAAAADRARLAIINSKL